MLINSSKLLGALMNVLDEQNLELWGVYDKTQMEGVLQQWNGQPHVQWKVDAVHRLLREAELIGKESLPYRPGHSHNFMHNKLLIVDDTVITGSYNLSHAAQSNAENMLGDRKPGTRRRCDRLRPHASEPISGQPPRQPRARAAGEQR